jgi:cell division transport system permease protein
MIMKFSTFFYTLRQGIKNIFRNKKFSLASIGTMSACIFLFGVVFAVVANFHSMVKEVESQISITVFFDSEASDEQVEEIGEILKKRVEVADIEYVSGEEAWEEYKEDYFSGSEEAAASFADDNPLADSDHYIVYLNDVSMQKALVQYAESIEGVRQVNKAQETADTLTDFNTLFGYLSAGIILILIAVAIFLISITVTNGIYVRREEIAIMKLIGATDYFVRAPFVVEGMLIGLIGAALPLLLLHYLYTRLIRHVMESFQMLGDFLSFLPVQEVFRVLIPVGLLLGVGIGFIGSYSTVRKHLKV